jgi:hypothetical protein
MKNKVYYVSQKEMVELREALRKDDSLYIADINGSDIQSLQDYLNTVNAIFKFPIPARGLDGYFDWIRDLDWLMKDGYVLIINDFSKFIKNDLQMKNKIVEDFEKVVLPWWQEEVEKCVVEGKAKPFNVYLVD